jgi:hypothetical protein
MVVYSASFKGDNGILYKLIKNQLVTRRPIDSLFKVRRHNNVTLDTLHIQRCGMSLNKNEKKHGVQQDAKNLDTG